MVIIRNEEGLTLVETIIALVLMLVLMAAFAGAMVVGLQSEVEVDKRLEASNLASSIVEYLGEGNNLKNIVEINDGDEPEDYREEVILYIDDNYKSYYYYDENKKTIEDSFDSELFFDQIRLNNSSEKETTEIRIKKYNENDKLYKVTVNVVWDDRGNKWSNNLVTLLAVD